MQNPHFDINTLAASIAHASSSLGLEHLVQQLRDELELPKLQMMGERGGWYRIGGLLSAEGERVSNSLTHWVDAEGGDLDLIVEKYAESGLQVTRHLGTTHYLSLPVGDGVADYYQIEIEALQEHIAHPLIDPNNPVEDLEELIDPLTPRHELNQPIGEGHYSLRRASHIGNEISRDNLHKGEELLRFLVDWEHSSASIHTPIYQQWVMLMGHYKDRYGDQIPTITPYPVSGRLLAGISDEAIERGAELAKQIHQFDRQAGYPMAWYFFMLTQKRVSARVAEAILSDLMGAYDYLPQRDLAVLRQWADLPYHI